MSTAIPATVNEVRFTITGPSRAAGFQAVTSHSVHLGCLPSLLFCPVSAGVPSVVDAAWLAERLEHKML